MAKELIKYSSNEKELSMLKEAKEFKNITNQDTYKKAVNLVVDSVRLVNKITDHYATSLDAAKKTVKYIQDNMKESLAPVAEIRDILQSKLITYYDNRKAVEAIPGVSYRQVRNKNLVIDEKKLPKKYFKLVPDEDLIKKDLVNGPITGVKSTENTKTTLVIKTKNN